MSDQTEATDFAEVLQAIDRAHEQLAIMKSGPEFLDEAMLAQVRSDSTKYARLIPDLMMLRHTAVLSGDFHLRERVDAILAGLTRLCDEVAALHREAASILRVENQVF